MTYVARRNLAVTETATMHTTATGILAERAARLVTEAYRTNRVEAAWRQRVENGQRTPAAEVCPDAANDITAFLADMSEVENRGALTFRPSLEALVRPEAMPVENGGRRTKRRVRFERDQAAAAAAQPAAPAWAEARGWVVGTVKHPANWTSVEHAPNLLVLFTDGTMGTVPASVNEHGRIIPNLNTQPQAVHPDARPSYGVYTPVVPNVLAGVKLEEGVAEYLNGPVAGSVFAHYDDVGAVLEHVAEQHGVLQTAPFSVEELNPAAFTGNGAAASNGARA